MSMLTIKVFKNGNLKAVRIPDELRFHPVRRQLTRLMDKFAALPDDVFEQGREFEEEIDRM